VGAQFRWARRKPRYGGLLGRAGGLRAESDEAVESANLFLANGSDEKEIVVQGI